MNSTSSHSPSGENEKQINANPSDGKDFSKNSINVQCKNVSKIFKQGELEVEALKNVDLSVYAGEIIVIMGPSGSGKTTLLNCISGLEKPTTGQILVRDHEVTKMNDAEIQILLQNEIGIVFQFFNLIPSLTAEGNMELPMIIAGKSDEYKKDRVASLLEEIGLEDRAHHRPFTLSGGEKQRIAIAMAFANNPTVILADEPTGNIDSVSAKRVLHIFEEFIEKNPDKSVIIVTHDPSIRRIANRTLIIKDGEIIEEIGQLEEEAIIEEMETKKKEQEADDKDLTEEDKDKEKLIFPTFDEVSKCPLCNSSNIIKKYDEDKGKFELYHDQLITRAIIYCKQCHQMRYLTVNIRNL